MRIFAKAVLALLVVCFAFEIHAQDVASITGVVSDATGAVIPGASVTLQNPSTGVTYQTVTNGAGSYTISEVKPGPGYKITITQSGFKPLVVTDIYMNVDSTRTQNARLTVGGTTQTVTVSASTQTVTLNTTDATVGNNFQVQFVQDLPIQYRDTPAALFTMQPGVTLDGAVAGARVDQSNVTLDGLEVNDNATGNFGNIVGNAPVDSVQEFRAVTANPLASAGQGGGGQFELVTRSGTNQFHGDLNEYHRDTALEANDWFNNNAGVPRQPLIRNQFGGSVGGPILRNKAFFFFDYNARRDTLSALVERTVPLPSYLAGNVSYINNTNGVETLDSAQLVALDPAHLGFNSAIQSLFSSRYPKANDLSGDYGDLVNTAGYRFNYPEPYKESNYIERVDYTLNDKWKFFGRGTVTRTTAIQSANQFPTDPVTYPFADNSYAYVGGATWTINNHMVNQAYYGETFEDYSFDVTYNPQGANQYGFAGLSGPYGGGSNSQARTYPVPVFRDDFNWTKGKHNLAFGGSFKWETPNDYAAENFNFPSIGVTGNTNFTALNPTLRPSDISSNQSATSIFDNLYTDALGVVASVSSNFNYNNKGVQLTQGSGLSLKYRNYETEIYASDTWKLTPQWTLSYGVRYENYTVPYEINGEEARSSFIGQNDSYGFSDFFNARLSQSSQGLQGNSALPLMQYTYGGKTNNAPGYYQPSNYNIAPRIGFVYNPSYALKTVFTVGAGLIYDHTVVNAIQFQQLQSSYLFEALDIPNLFGTAGKPAITMTTAPRFAGISSPPPAPAAPNVTTPFVPFTTSGGAPYGLPDGAFNTTIDPNLKTPYSLQFSAGMQHEFPGGFILKMNYVGREGRRLLGQADASQLVEFPDNTGGSTQTMSQAMAGMVTQLRANAGLGIVNDIYSLSAQPWYEDMIYPGIGQAYGFANNTQFIAYNTYPYPQRGDFADMTYLLSAFGLLAPNVGMASQWADNNFYTNKGFSSYNGLLVTLHKNAGYGLQFDLNYTWSNSIDNTSLVANANASGGAGFICDVARPRECRGHSDFDVAQYFNGNFIYALPFGRGQQFGATMPFWVNELVGGWSVSGLPSIHSGNAYYAGSNAFVASFANLAPATLIGDISNTKVHLTRGANNSLNEFANAAAAQASFTGPTGFAIGSRNNLRGPNYFNLDLGVGKNFPIYSDKVLLKFRCDAFNSTNHPSFSAPGSLSGAMDITGAEGTPFGTLSSTANGPRVLQGSLRLEF